MKARGWGLRPFAAEIILPPEGYELVMRQGMMFAIQIEVRSKLGALRVIVGDARSGALGSLNIPLKDVPPAPNTAPPPPPAAEKP